MDAYLREVPEQPELWTSEGPQLEFALRRTLAKGLHWDFRIKARGMLYTWRALRPPSFDPAVPVRLTLQEPQLPESLYSERRPPAGGRGRSPIIVEDCGHCRPLYGSPSSGETTFHAEFEAGRIDLAFDAHILRGAFRIERRGTVWGIRKLPDEHVATGHWPWTGKSVLSDMEL